MLFTFAGSTHTKYGTYLLELITNLELESSWELKETVLNSMLVNLSGREGAFTAGDIIQEFFNRLLEAIIERKGAKFGEPFVRRVISRNLHHMGRVKTAMRESLGLAARTGKHSDPHMNPEVKTLLQQYAFHELHTRRAGRSIEEDVPDDFTRGWERLGQGKIRKWVAETTRARSLRAKGPLAPVDSTIPDFLDGSDSEDESDDESGDPRAGTFGAMSFVDGEFVIETFDTEETISALMEELEESDEVVDGVEDIAGEDSDIDMNT